MAILCTISEGREGRCRSLVNDEGCKVTAALQEDKNSSRCLATDNVYAFFTCFSVTSSVNEVVRYLLDKYTSLERRCKVNSLPGDPRYIPVELGNLQL